MAAYDDAQGVTAAFDKNVLTVLNRDLDADFDLDAFAHRSVWVEEHERIEMRLESLRDQRVHLRGIDLEIELAAGEQVRTEISSKFRREGVTAELAAAGLELVRVVDRPGRRLRPQPVRPELAPAPSPPRRRACPPRRRVCPLSPGRRRRR